MPYTDEEKKEMSKLYHQVYYQTKKAEIQAKQKEYRDKRNEGVVRRVYRKYTQGEPPIPLVAKPPNEEEPEPKIKLPKEPKIKEPKIKYDKKITVIPKSSFDISFD